MGATLNAAEAELKADLYWRFGSGLPAPVLKLMHGVVRRQLRARLSNQDITALSGEAARALYRRHIEQLVADFAAWTPLADLCDLSGGVGSMPAGS